MLVFKEASGVSSCGMCRCGAGLRSERFGRADADRPMPWLEWREASTDGPVRLGRCRERLR